MSRSLKKGPYIDERLLKKVQAAKKTGGKVKILTWSRDCVISPEMVGTTIAIHNGKEHIPVFIAEDMIGHRLGEFAPTRRFRKHGGRMAREEEMGATGQAPKVEIKEEENEKMK